MNRSQEPSNDNPLPRRLMLMLVLTLLLGTPATSLSAMLARPALRSDTHALARPRAQDELLALARARPDDPVAVIVQKRSADQDVEARVATLGGTVTRDLSIINGFSAILPARAASLLGQDEAVRWVSLDAPVEKSGDTNRYYLHLDGSMTTTPPEVEALREGASGLSLSGEQRWQIGPFPGDRHLYDKVEFKFYAAAEGFAKQDGIVRATLRHRTASGVVAWSLSSTAAREWDDKWQRETIDFDNVDRHLRAGDTLELVVTTAPSSPAPMMLALDTEEQESHLKMSLVDPLLGNDLLYFAAAAPGHTPSQALLPITAVEPPDIALPNYDTDRDSGPGLLIRRGGNGGLESDPTRIQRWRLATFTANTQLPKDIEVTFYAAIKDFRESYGKVWVHLLDVDESGQTTVIASGYHDRTWNDKWEDEKVEFKDLFEIIEAGHSLEIAFTVDGASSDDMWFALGTDDERAEIKLSSDGFFPVLANPFLDTVGAPEAWAMGYEGQGVRVAVLDSGIWSDAPDFREIGGFRRVVEEVKVNPTVSDAKDKFGHGTFIAGIIGSNGHRSQGMYRGVAPQVEMINVRVSNENGGATESDVLAGMQWVLQNRDTYNIRVVNMSLNSTSAQSYHTSPMNAAAEILWFNGIVVVVAGGNNGDEDQGNIYPPANDPFVIAVGATEDRGTADPADDGIATFSAFGTTPDGYFRPDLAAPGTYVVSSLANSSRFQGDFLDLHSRTKGRDGKVNPTNFVASGTSASAGVVSGAAALLLQAVPDLNPDQVKWVLKHSSTPLPGEPGAGAGIVHIPSAIHLALGYADVSDVPTANTGQPASDLLMSGDDSANWSSVSWGSVNWNSVNWNSVNWNSVNWNSVNWNSVNWNSLNQGSVDLDY